MANYGEFLANYLQVNPTRWLQCHLYSNGTQSFLLTQEDFRMCCILFFIFECWTRQWPQLNKVACLMCWRKEDRDQYSWTLKLQQPQAQRQFPWFHVIYVLKHISLTWILFSRYTRYTMTWWKLWYTCFHKALQDYFAEKLCAENEVEINEAMDMKWNVW